MERERESIHKLVSTETLFQGNVETSQAGNSQDSDSATEQAPTVINDLGQHFMTCDWSTLHKG